MKFQSYYMALLISCFCFSFFQETIAQSLECSWAHAFGSKGWDLGWTIIADPSGNGNIYATGFFNGTVDFDPTEEEYLLTSIVKDEIYVMKFNSSGSLLWAKGIPGKEEVFSRGKTVAIDGNGDVYVTGSYTDLVDFDPGIGTFYQHSHGRRDIFVVKLSNDGDFVWARSIGSKESDSATSIAINPGGDEAVYIAGDFRLTVDFDPGPDTFNLTSMGYSDIFITKMDLFGNFIWAKSFNGPSFEDVYSIAVDPSGNGAVYLTGDFYDTVDFDPDQATEYNLMARGYNSGFISKLDGEGNFVWAKALSGEYVAGISIAINPGGNGEVYTLGNFSGIVDFDPGEDVFNLEGYGLFISKLDSLGNFVWAKAITGIEDSLAGLSMVIEEKGNGEIYLTGGFYETIDFDPGAETFNLTSAGDIDIFVCSLDFSGNFLGASSFGGPGLEFAISIETDPSEGSLLMTGIFDGSPLPLGTITLSSLDSSGAEIFIARFNLITSVEDVANPLHPVNVYPNPASESLSIEFENTKSLPVHLVVYNILGEIVLQQAEQFSTNVITLDIADLAAGMYVMDCYNNGIRYSGKFVKE